jgi:hypothetical protein
MLRHLDGSTSNLVHGVDCEGNSVERLAADKARKALKMDSLTLQLQFLRFKLNESCCTKYVI